MAESAGHVVHRILRDHDGQVARTGRIKARVDVLGRSVNVVGSRGMVRSLLMENCRPCSSGSTRSHCGHARPWSASWHEGWASSVT